MPRAFADVSALTVHAEHLADTGDRIDIEGRKLMDRLLGDTWERMRDEVPVDEGETRDHITVDVDSDGLGGSVGPTNADETGKPIGFFIEYGTSSMAPNPFVQRTSAWAERTVPDRVEEMVREIL